MKHNIHMNDKKYRKSYYDQRDKVREHNLDRHSRQDEDRKLKRSHNAKNCIYNNKCDQGEYKNRDKYLKKRKKYDDVGFKKHRGHVTNCNIFKHNFSAISDLKSKSQTKRTYSTHTKRSNSVDSNSENGGSSSEESDDKKLLEILRLKRSHLIAELASHENQTRGPESVNISNSFGVTDEINIKFEQPDDKYSNANKSEENCVTNGDCLDMFADNFNHAVASNPVQLVGRATENDKLNDNWDDNEGYYKIRLGELIGGRYAVFNLTGKGVFSNVVKARDVMNNDEEVAIKLIRNNDMMYRAGLKEVDFLKKINEIDKHDKYHCVRLIRSLMHKNHLCLVFECLDMNLREVLKKYGRHVGLNIAAIRSYGQQLLLALKLIQRAEVIHGDVKSDNILVNESKTVLKLSDFGSAVCLQENEVAEYMVSRFYRAPEVILGLRYDCGIDLWAVGVTLYEMYTGQVMFPGKDNNEMLRLMMEAKGRLPNKMVKKAFFKDKYFDEQFNFLQKEVDKITEMAKVRLVRAGHPRSLSYDFFARLKQVDDDDHKVKQFRDFLDRILQLDPSKRMTINDALNHSFITETSKK